jgi:integrase
MRRFSLFKRNNSPFFYVQIKNPKTGKYLPPRSTGCRDKDEALLVVADWIKYGIPQSGRRRAFEDVFMLSTLLSYIENATITEKDAVRIITALKDKGLIESAVMAGEGPENMALVPFLAEFWDYDNSEYVRDKLAYGQKIGRRHCYEQSKRLCHWEEFFEDARLKDVNRSMLKEFQFFLFDKGKASKTINHIISVGLTAFKWMYTEERMSYEIGRGLRKFSGEGESRGILTPDEAKRLFLLEWKNDLARVGNLVAATTGLRAGEVCALRPQDIGEKTLYVRNSFSRIEKLKDTKNHEEGEVPLLPAVRDELMRLADENPHSKGGYIFYSEDPEKPISQRTLLKGLENSLVKLRTGSNPSKEQVEKAAAYWEERNVVFHSWRHYYATYIADRVDLRTAQFAMRHKTAAMTQHYANHKNEERMKELSAAVVGAFGNIVEFKDKSGAAS